MSSATFTSRLILPVLLALVGLVPGGARARRTNMLASQRHPNHTTAIAMAGASSMAPGGEAKGESGLVLFRDVDGSAATPIEARDMFQFGKRLH